MSEAERWKCIALYLADCHAGTSEYDGELKSTSASRRDRFAAICAKALAYLQGTDTPYTRTLDQEARIMDRLRAEAGKRAP